METKFPDEDLAFLLLLKAICSGFLNAAKKDPSYIWSKTEWTETIWYENTYGKDNHHQPLLAGGVPGHLSRQKRRQNQANAFRWRKMLEQRSVALLQTVECLFWWCQKLNVSTCVNRNVFIKHEKKRVFYGCDRSSCLVYCSDHYPHLTARGSSVSSQLKLH